MPECDNRVKCVNATGVMRCFLVTIIRDQFDNIDFSCYRRLISIVFIKTRCVESRGEGAKVAILSFRLCLILMYVYLIYTNLVVLI